MKKEVDFLFRYEHKVRELESIMLIRLELERRGYSVAFIGNYEYDNETQYCPKVFVSPAVYSNGQLYGDFFKYGAIKKIANLQWEQLLGVKEEEDINGFHNIKGLGQRIVNFCWGEQSRKRYINGGVASDRAIVVGQVNTDLLRGAFRNLLYTKEQLADRYNLDANKTWLFFISSFAYCEMDESQIWICKKALGEKGFESFTNVSYLSRDAILDWFEDVLVRDSRKLIIYRPHPDETEKCERLKQMSRKYVNFRVIGQEALKHWVNASDKIYNWFSTGVVDVIIQDKPYRLLRPIPIDEELDYRMMHCAQSIETKVDFDADLDDFTKKEVISSDMFRTYFYIPDNNFIYVKICDILEELLKTEKYDLRYRHAEYLYIKTAILKGKILNLLRLCLNHFPKNLYPSFVKRLDTIKQRNLNMMKAGYKKNVATIDEIEELRNRFKPIVDGEQI